MSCARITNTESQASSEVAGSVKSDYGVMNEEQTRKTNDDKVLGNSAVDESHQSRRLTHVGVLARLPTTVLKLSKISRQTSLPTFTRIRFWSITRRIVQNLKPWRAPAAPTIPRDRNALASTSRGHTTWATTNLQRRSRALTLEIPPRSHPMPTMKKIRLWKRIPLAKARGSSATRST
jgi:hypothetical protein